MHVCRPFALALSAAVSFGLEAKAVTIGFETFDIPNGTVQPIGDLGGAVTEAGFTFTPQGEIFNASLRDGVGAGLTAGNNLLFSASPSRRIVVTGPATFDFLEVRLGRFDLGSSGGQVAFFGTKADGSEVSQGIPIGGASSNLRMFSTATIDADFTDLVSLDIDLFTTNSIGFDDFVFSSSAEVPLPAPGALLLGAIALIASWARTGRAAL